MTLDPKREVVATGLKKLTNWLDSFGITYETHYPDIKNPGDGITLCINNPDGTICTTEFDRKTGNIIAVWEK